MELFVEQSIMILKDEMFLQKNERGCDNYICLACPGPKEACAEVPYFWVNPSYTETPQEVRQNSQDNLDFVN